VLERPAFAGRKMAGLYFEEFTVGRVFDHAWTRTVTEMDNVLFSSLTMNVQPLHLDEEFASKTEFGQRIVNSLFTLGLMIGITVNDTTLGTTIANLGMTDVKFPKPVFHGDTLKVRTTVLSARESKSRADKRQQCRAEKCSDCSLHLNAPAVAAVVMPPSGDGVNDSRIPRLFYAVCGWNFRSAATASTIMTISTVPWAI